MGFRKTEGLPKNKNHINSMDIAICMQPKLSKATFAAGCFWGVEETFRNIKGVIRTTVGYIGGATKHPTYEQVCTDTTDHAEAVEVEYDPKLLSYEELLQIFWNCHDLTTMNRQGPDVGTQYRSGIFYHNPQQKKAAISSRNAQQKKLGKPIVTEIVPATTFYKAEEYHQQYLKKKGVKVCH